MKIGKDISAQFKELYIVHQNIPGKKANLVSFVEHILFIPLQGEITVTVGDKKYSAHPGQMIYLAPNIVHSFHASSHSGERLIAMLAPRSLKTHAKQCITLPLNQLIKEILFYLLLHPNTKNTKSLVSIFSKTLSEAFEKTSYSAALDHIEGKVVDPRIKRALSLMESNNNVSISDIAKKAAISSRNFNRLFLKETGLQPKQWLIHARMNQAKILLKKPGATVTHVAMEVGYHSLSQFIAVFRSYTGKLPFEFLKVG